MVTSSGMPTGGDAIVVVVVVDGVEKDGAGVLLLLLGVAIALLLVDLGSGRGVVGFGEDNASSAAAGAADPRLGLYINRFPFFIGNTPKKPPME
jgi:hypothetical protein